MKITFGGLWSFKMSLGMVVAIGTAAHLLVTTHSSLGVELNTVKTLSDIAWIQLLLGAAAAFGAMVWRVWREKKVDLLLLASFFLMILMTAFFAFSWTLELDGIRG
jgi:hypothetical protein